MHSSVLLDESLAALAPSRDESYIDATIGLGGHAERILEANGPVGRLLGIDADPEAIKRAQERLTRFGDRLKLVSGNFRDLEMLAKANGFSNVGGILFDLGISSLQLSEAGRGFSFQSSAPLDMRMNPDLPETAADLVNDLDVRELADLLYRYGEEPNGRQIARALVRQRPFHTTTELAEAIAGTVPRRGSRTHPATRTFQALRMHVNDELGQLRRALAAALELLAVGGRLVVISFHSLEDRIAKQFIQANSAVDPVYAGLPVIPPGAQPRMKRVGSKIRAGVAELEANPRARSSVLRVAEKVRA
jgi:16S rRNA (cytosine1402-N4)-methyltransferase